MRVKRPGERIGIDMMEIKNNDYIIVAIDYFTRKIFAKSVNSKEAGKIVNFLDQIYSVMKFETLLSDNGREFDNQEVNMWVKKKSINHIFSIPYYKKSNGRVERANRTIRNALKKSKGPTKMNIKRIVYNYNNIPHRAIGMSPNDAMNPLNWERVAEHTLKYSKEFLKGSKVVTKFNDGEKVLIRNEFKTNKMDDEFRETGTIVKNEYGNIYEILDKNGCRIRRHAAQIRRA